MQNKFLSLIFGLVVYFSGVAFATEKIQSFDSLIQVHPDGTMDVTETITIHHEGINVRRGIYRDLPTDTGNEYKLISVRRNGYDEPNFVKERRGFYQINTGDDSFLPHPGTSTFEIKYRVWNQPKAFDGYDEVYWNVTGNQWALPIERVSAKIELPHGAEILKQSSYIGFYHDQTPGTYAGDGQFYGRYLAPGEQFTVAIGFTPGIVAAQKKPTNLDSTSIVVGVLNSLVYTLALYRDIAPILLYFIYLGILIFLWYRYGRDPKPRAIMPQYLPPKNLTAAQAACIHNKKEPKNLITISLVQMISNGFLKITTKKEKIFGIWSDTEYTLEKTGQKPSNPEEECIAVNKMKLDGVFRQNVANTVDDIKAKITKSMKAYYTNKQRLIVPVTLIYLLVMGLMWLPGLYPLLIMVFMLLFFIHWASGLNLTTVIAIIIWTTFVSIMLAAGLGIAFGAHDWLKLIFAVFVIITFKIFHILMYQPTEQGQRTTEYLAGLKMFLKATKLSVKEEQNIEEKLSKRNMEKLFPYALALGIEKDWARKFAKIFGELSYEEFVERHPYVSHSARSAFSSSLATASIAPSSGSSSRNHDSWSSGSDGGGFAGGGGGGR